MSIPNAFMLRNDGEAFSVPYHPYGTDGIEYVIDYMPWLYKSTSTPQTRQFIRNLVMLLIDADIIDEDEKEFQDIIQATSAEDELGLSGRQLSANIEESLNNEFCRVRLGGTYDSDNEVPGEIVFRISSSSFNWYPVIWEYVYSHRSGIDFVTIVKDLESTGSEEVYSHGRHKFYRMPVTQFITLEGNPVIEQMEG